MPRRKGKKKGEDAPAPPPEVGGSLKDRGNKAFQQQNFAEAKELFTSAIEEDGTNHVLFSNRSAVNAALEDYEAALEDAERCISLKSDWPKGFFRKGHALEKLLRFPEAFASYKEGLAIDENDPSCKPAAEELRTLMEELRMTEAEMNQDNPDGDKFERMVKWMKDGGAKFPKLYLQYYSDDYRGCHCLAKIPPEEIILYVPHDYIMTSDVAKASEIGQAIIRSGVDLRSKHSYLASYVIQEKHKGAASFWKPYLDVLPQHYANMPIFFSEDHLAMLKGSMTLQKIVERIDSLRREYDSIRKSVPEFAKFTHEEFVWARLVVITRIFGLVINGTKTDGLSPYADMLNHKVPKETSWTYDDGMKGMIIKSLKTLQRGEQVYDSYGRKCNSRFFVNYGFAMDENDDNEAVMRFELPENDPHYTMKIRFLGGKPYQRRREFQVPGKTYRHKKCKSLFSFLRFVCGMDSELMLLSSADNFKLEDIEPISVRNELEVLKLIAKAAQISLDAFETTLEQDEKLIASGQLPLYSNERNCVVMRRGEKQVLHWYLDIAERATPLLKLQWKDLKKIAAKCYHGTTGFDTYVTAVVVPLVKKGT